MLHYVRTGQKLLLTDVLTSCSSWSAGPPVHLLIDNTVYTIIQYECVCIQHYNYMAY